MSGHSKWATIKRKKGVKDAARSKLFTKLGKDILVAAQQGGADPEMNFSLRLAVDRAKVANMPADNIQRMIQKASGELKSDKIMLVTYEAYGPGGSMIIVDCETDNTNRSLTEVKALIHKAGGKMASEGSISWQFDLLGQVSLEAKVENPNTPYGKEQMYDAVDIDQLQLDILDVPGVVDLQVDSEDNSVIVLTEREELSPVRDNLMQKKLKVTEAQMVRLPQNYLEISAEEKEQLETIISGLEDLDDVDEVWTNVILDA